MPTQAAIEAGTANLVHYGRKAGTPNLTTQALVTKILRTLDKLGGEAYLERLAKSDPHLFNALLSRVIPRDVNITANITFEHRLAELEASQAVIDGEVSLGDYKPKRKALPPPGPAHEAVPWAEEALTRYRAEHPEQFAKPGPSSASPLAEQAEATEPGDGGP